MLEAKDLPRCDLSDFIEQRLALAIGRDRHERARQARVQVEQARLACPAWNPSVIWFLRAHRPRPPRARAAGARAGRAGAPSLLCLEPLKNMVPAGSSPATATSARGRRACRSSRRA